MKDFNYYIFIDYSESLLGYIIVEQTRISELIPKIAKFTHYKDVKNKQSYLHSIKSRIDREHLHSFLLKCKIKSVRYTPEIYADLVEFIRKNDNCLIFISIDDKQYSNVERLVDNIYGENNKVVKESQLKKDSKEYRLSLILDTLLNIERTK